MSLTLCQFSKKNLIWNVLWNVWNFGYYIKNNFLCNTQSFRHSTGRFRWDFFFENWHNVRDIFCKKLPQLWKRLTHSCLVQTSDYRGSLLSKQELVWLHYCSRLYIKFRHQYLRHWTFGRRMIDFRSKFSICLSVFDAYFIPNYVST